MTTDPLASELQRRMTDLAAGRTDLAAVLEWAGRLDLEHGRKPIGPLLFAGGRPPESLEGFAAPPVADCRTLARAVALGVLGLEDVVGLVALRHARSVSDRPLVDWLVQFGAVHPSQREDLSEGGDTDR